MNKAQIKKAVEERVNQLNEDGIIVNGSEDYYRGFSLALRMVFDIMDEIEGVAFKRAMDKADNWPGE